MKQTTKHWFTYFLAVLALTMAFNVLAGDKQPPPPMQIFYSSNTNANNPVISNTPAGYVKNPQLKELERQLDASRISGNTASAKQIQAQIDALLGNVQVYQENLAFSFNESSGNPEPVTDYSQTSIHNLSIFSHALSIAPSNSPIAGRLFYLLTQEGTGADTLKLMQSTNNGQTWTDNFHLGINGYTLNRDELDMEVVYDGTNVWIFGVVGFTDQTDGRKKVYFFRRNITTSTYYGTMLNFPGNGTGMNYYNPRITSDNSNFTSNAYVMILCSMDSTASPNHFVKQKYVLSSSPFDAAPSLNYAQPNGSSGFGWSGVTNSTYPYLYGDIAYYKDDSGTGENRVMTVYGNYASLNIYIAYLNGYSTLGAGLYISESNQNKNVKIAFNGGPNNRNGMITYVRQFNATDWDIFAIRTTNGGSAPANWVRDTLDYSGDFARNCDLVAVRQGANQFKVVYGQDNSNNSNNPTAYYKSFNGSAWTNSYVFSNNKIDTVFAKPRAGYTLTGGDDGVAVWSAIGGFNGYYVKQMITTTGVSGNNEIPTGFSLSQNYPNPFNPVTNIKFSVPVTGIITLKVYDITGKEAATLISQNMNAGSYTVDFDASHLASGVYFYRLTADGFTDVKKMMLVK